MIDALPAWLRDDGRSAAQATATFGQLQGALGQAAQLGLQQQNVAHDNWIQDAQLSLAQEAQKTRQQMAAVQIETEKSKLQQQQEFAAETPMLLEYNKKLKTAKTQEELDAIPVPEVKTLQAAQLLQQGKIYQEGEIAKYKLQGYAADVDRRVNDWITDYGVPPTGQDLLEIKQAAAAKADPAAAIRGLATEQRGLDALERTKAQVQGRIDAATMAQLGKELGGVKARQVQTAVDNGVQALESYGIPVSDAEIKAFTSGAMTSGGAVQAPPIIAKQIATEDTSFEQLDQALTGIDKFDKKYGTDAFKSVVGPFDSALQKFEQKNDSKLTPKEKDAAKIFRKFAYIVQGYRNGQFGSALTEGESQKFKEIVGDSSFNDYEDALRTFRNSVGNAVRIKVNNYKLAPNVSVLTKKRFLVDFAPNDDGDLVPTEAAAVVTPAAVPGKIPAFNTPAEAEAANLPKGTIITVGGRRAVVE